MRANRRILLATLGGLFVLAPAASAGRSDPATQARQAIQAAYDAMDQAADRKDLDGFFSLVDPEYVALSPAPTHTDAGKTARMTLAEMRPNMARLFQVAKSIQVIGTIQKFHLDGRTAVATINGQTAIVIVNPQTGKTVRVTNNNLSEDTWVKSGNRWLLRQSRSLSSQQKADPLPSP